VDCRHIRRGGTYLRVCDPTWADPLDVTYSQLQGGRWNPKSEFGALYLCATVTVAAANACKTYEGEVATLFDLRPEMQPDLVVVSVLLANFVDFAVRAYAAHPAR
jgi:RES domain-containing protein